MKRRSLFTALAAVLVLPDAIKRLRKTQVGASAEDFDGLAIQAKIRTGIPPMRYRYVCRTPLPSTGWKHFSNSMPDPATQTDQILKDLPWKNV